MKTATTCKRCGTPIPQQQGRGRPRLYCEGSDCQAAAKRTRALRRTTPGLEGALARAEDLYERMETELAAAIQPLAESLAAELDPAKVEEKIAQASQAADARVAAARAERDDALAKAAQASKAEAGARAEAQAAVAEAEAARSDATEHAEAAAIAEHRAVRAEQAAREAEQAAAEAGEVAAAAERARTVALAERDEAVEERDEAEARAEAAQAAQRVAQEKSAALVVERDIARAGQREAETQRMDAVSAAAVAAAETQRLRGELETVRSEAAAQLDSVRSEAAARIDAAEHQAANARDDAAASATERDQLNGQLAALRLRLDDFRSTIQQARSESAALRERAVAAELELRALRAATASPEGETGRPARNSEDGPAARG